MIYIRSFLLSLLITVGAYSSYSDCKKGIIYNIVVIIGMCGAVIGNTIYFIFNQMNGLIPFLTNLLSAIIISGLMYLLKIWAGGDVKLFVVLAALIPTDLLKQRIPLSEVFIFILVFSAAFLYILLQSIVFFVRKEKSPFPKTKLSLIQIFPCFLFVMAVQSIMRTVFRNVYSDYFGAFMFFNIILVLLYGKIEFLTKRISIIICSLICTADIVLSIYNGRLAFDYRSFIVVFVTIVFRSLAARYNYQEIKTKDVKPGMIPAFSTVYLFSKSKVKGLPTIATEDMSARITKEEADSIIRWADSKNGKETIVILRKIPFAVFIWVGYVIYCILGIMVW